MNSQNPNLTLSSKNQYMYEADTCHNGSHGFGEDDKSLRQDLEWIFY